MRANKIKKMMKDGKPIVNGWLQIPSSFSAEVMSHQGWDSLTIDMQHGVIDYPNALQMLQAISTTDVTPLARVNWNEPGQIMKILDAGCYGVICPMVSNKLEAEKFVQACMYPPKGYRSFGPIRGLIYGGGDYGDHSNEEKECQLFGIASIILFYLTVFEFLYFYLIFFLKNVNKKSLEEI